MSSRSLRRRACGRAQTLCALARFVPALVHLVAGASEGDEEGPVLFRSLDAMQRRQSCSDLRPRSGHQRETVNGEKQFIAVGVPQLGQMPVMKSLGGFLPESDQRSDHV